MKSPIGAVQRMQRFPAMSSTAIVLVSMMSGACASDMTEPWEVKEPRLMGARVEVEGSPERSRPRLGERFSIRQFIALPGPLETPLAGRYDMDVALCLGFKTPSGSLACIGQQELSPTVETISDTEVRLSGLGLDLSSLEASEITLPTGIGDLANLPSIEALDRLAVFGVLCVDGRAERVTARKLHTDNPTQLFRCVSNQTVRFPDANTFTLSVLLDRNRPLDSNRNPAFACDPDAPDSVCTRGPSIAGEAQVGGSFALARPKSLASGIRTVEAWPAHSSDTALPWTDCATSPTILRVRAGSGTHALRVRFDPSDRERYQYEIESNGKKVLHDGREALLLSHALTSKGGELKRHFSELSADSDDAASEISVDYTPPEQGSAPDQHISPSGQLVRFYFTLRDERGGIDFATREVCLVPGDSKE